MRKVSTFFLAFCLSLGTAFGQNFETGYFLDGFPYAYRMNPALQHERGFFAVPVAGKLDLGLNTSLNVSDFLYNRNGKTVTFLHPDVAKEDFLKTISRAGEQGSFRLDAPVFALGFWSNEAFCTLDVNLRGNMSVRMPADLFRFLKNGTEDATAFQFSDLALSARILGEVAFGYSRRIDDRFTYGFRVKALAGMGQAQARFDKLQMDLGADQWTVQSQGNLSFSGDKISVKTKSSESDPSSQVLDFSTISAFSDDAVDMLRPSGYGAAADLGLTWTPFSWLTLSASILDLGAVRWSDVRRAKTPDNSFVYTPAENIPVGEGAGEAISEQMKKAFSGFDRIAEFSYSGSGTSLELMPFAALAGAEFRLPFYDRFSVGLLGSWQHDPIVPTLRGRLSANWAPLNWLSLSASGAMDNYRTGSLGAAVNLHTGFLTLFVGTDHLVTKAHRIPDFSWEELIGESIPMLEKIVPGIPEKLSTTLTFGLTLTIGQRRLNPAGTTFYRKEKAAERPIMPE